MPKSVYKKSSTDTRLSSAIGEVEASYVNNQHGDYLKDLSGYATLTVATRGSGQGKTEENEHDGKSHENGSNKNTEPSWRKQSYTVVLE